MRFLDNGCVTYLILVSKLFSMSGTPNNILLRAKGYLECDRFNNYPHPNAYPNPNPYPKPSPNPNPNPKLPLRCSPEQGLLLA